MTTNAQYAAMPLRRLGFAWLGFSAKSRGKATYGPAPITEPMQRPDGGAQMLALPLEVKIHQRAERVCNRNPALVEKYIRKHTILSRGLSCEV